MSEEFSVGSMHAYLEMLVVRPRVCDCLTFSLDAII